jgi:hypothetical protein
LVTSYFVHIFKQPISIIKQRYVVVGVDTSVALDVGAWTYDIFTGVYVDIYNYNNDNCIGFYSHCCLYLAQTKDKNRLLLTTIVFSWSKQFPAISYSSKDPLQVPNLVPCQLSTGSTRTTGSILLPVSSIGTYIEAYTGAYTRVYTGPYTGNYTGAYTGAYTGVNIRASADLSFDLLNAIFSCLHVANWLNSTLYTDIFKD